MPLALAGLGETKIITDFRGKEEVKKHLYNLGLVKGEAVQIVGENQSGIILLVKDVRIALNRALALKIMVK